MPYTQEFRLCIFNKYYHRRSRPEALSSMDSQAEAGDVKKYSVILGFLMILIFILPCVLLAFFSKYLVRSSPTPKVCRVCFCRNYAPAFVLLLWCSLQKRMRDFHGSRRIRTRTAIARTLTHNAVYLFYYCIILRRSRRRSEPTPARPR